MTCGDIAESAVCVLLALGAAVSLACSIGVMVMRGVYDKLHYLAPAGIIGTASVAAAIILREGVLSQAGIKSFLVFLVLLISGPVITQAASRAERVRAMRETGRGSEPEPEIETDE
ncbi:MAG TPA: monovalent cation/H(+) antiporter subunit G [Dissulfurispiraceae bacterium]